MLSLYTVGGRGLVLPHLGLPNFVDSTREALSLLRSACRVRLGVGEWEGGRRGGRGELGLAYKILKNLKKGGK